MGHNRNFFLGCFIAAMTGLCCNDTLLAGPMIDFATTENRANINNVLATTVYSETTAGDGTVVTVCPEGQYVYQCGNYRVGFNWLKSATLPQQSEDGFQNLIQTSVKTKNYYIGDTTLELFEQMRTFFGHNTDDNPAAISYIDPDNPDMGEQPALAAEYQVDRELILNNLCHPMTSHVTCAKCPNDAFVNASTVELDEDNLTIAGTWHFYTIADCHMQNFEDSTGSYFYIPDTVLDAQVPNTNVGALCYYTNTNPNAVEILSGDEIGTFVPGLNTSRTTTDFRIDIPTTNIRTFNFH